MLTGYKLLAGAVAASAGRSWCGAAGRWLKAFSPHRAHGTETTIAASRSSAYDFIRQMGQNLRVRDCLASLDLRGHHEIRALRPQGARQIWAAAAAITSPTRSGSRRFQGLGGVRQLTGGRCGRTWKS